MGAHAMAGKNDRVCNRTSFFIIEEEGFNLWALVWACLYKEEPACRNGLWSALFALKAESRLLPERKQLCVMWGRELELTGGFGEEMSKMNPSSWHWLREELRGELNVDEIVLSCWLNDLCDTPFLPFLLSFFYFYFSSSHCPGAISPFNLW